ncbi:TOM1-like protein 2 [Hyalella azteca]|uniref:TOM1-like protein 2 n=1 Tax=Hyalella azteca TaxID=294128 RepID=A0A8B7PDP0_HYAAZ|nr:TOM1-like protein 2 [Hyalella azteca]
MAFFTNPLTTPIGQKIEKATSDTLASEDWSLNLEICDLINSDSGDELAKDAVRAIKKRLNQSPKNFKIVSYTLTLLESCVKNTGYSFHILVCSKEFVQDLVKLIGPKNDPPSCIQLKVLLMIQSWNEAFKHQPELSGVCQVYCELKHKGIEFPPAEADAAPIITPHKSISPLQCSAGDDAGRGAGAELRPPTLGGTSPRHPSTPSPPAPAYPPPAQGVTHEVREKLVKELGVVETELYATCQAMQKRVVELVARVSDDILTADLLRINDLLNNVFIRYDRHMSKSRAKSSPVRTPEGVLGSSHRPPSRPPPLGDAGAVGGKALGASRRVDEAVGASSGGEVSLIDLAVDDAPALPPVLPATRLSPLPQQLGNLSLDAGRRDNGDDFDSFAQSRTSVADGAKKDQELQAAVGAASNSVNKSHDPAVEATLLEVESNFESMERWMSSQPYGAEVSSDAFQKFLADRAAAAEQLPSLPSPGAASASNTQP